MKTNNITHLLSVMEKYDISDIQYVTYPLVNEWKTAEHSVHYANKLKLLKQNQAKPLSLFVHIPFSKELYLFADHPVSVAKEHSATASYIECLKKEVGIISDLLGFKSSVNQLHFGGGTPTFLYPEEMIDLMETINRQFEVTMDAEISIDIDPTETSVSYLKMLTRLGFNRFVFKIQDFDLQVQKAIHHEFSFAHLLDLIDEAKKFNIKNITIELVYGLPLQTPESFYDTLVRTSLLNPDHVMLTPYEHAPWLNKHQRLLDHLPRPNSEDKLQYLMMAHEFFEQSEMVSIGTYFFTKVEDPLYQLFLQRNLHKNTIGYSEKSSNDLIGLGSSAISFINNSYFKNLTTQLDYENHIQAEKLANELFYDLTEDDIIRKGIVNEILNNGQINFHLFKEKTGREFLDYFQHEFVKMTELEKDGLVIVWSNRIAVTKRGWFFLGFIAMRFDSFINKHYVINPLTLTTLS